jgi:anti-anti-sigma regulatory factor
MPDHPDSPAPESELTYFIAEKHGILVVSLVGAISKASEEVLKKCVDEIEKSQARSVVLNFLGVDRVEKPGIPEFTRLQLLVRRKPAELRVCFLRPTVAAFLNDAGVLRPTEVSQGLKEAIVSLAFRRAG